MTGFTRTVLIAILTAGVTSTCGMGVARITIVDNLIAQNGIGIYIGWFGDWDVVIEANKIFSNGEGIRLKNQRAVIVRNVLRQNVVGLLVATEHQETVVVKAIESVVVNFNVFEQNELYAIWNQSKFVIRADRNWWGSPEGPVLELGRANALAGLVEAFPWLTIPPL